MKPASFRDIALACRCSAASVSRALAGSPVVRAGLARAIRTKAKALGYQRNPLVGSLMAQLRTRRSHAFKGNLAMVRVGTPGQEKLLPFHQRLLAGAQRRAAELGFSLELFTLGAGGYRAGVLTRILKARGILGLIMLHARETAEVEAFPWDEFSAIELDYSLHELLLDTIMIDHHVTLTRALERLAAKGYRRGGLFLERNKDERVKFKWSAAFRSFQENHGGFGEVPVLRFDSLEPRAFLDWFDRHRPDLLIGHRDEVISWLEKRDVAVPRDVGFFNLNWNEHKKPCAGLDLRPELQGSVAVEIVIAHVTSRKRGLPKEPHSVMVNGTWVDGPTLKE